MLLLLLIDSASATTWVVDQSGGGDATTLASGFALLADGDTLEVRAGTYYEGGIDVSANDITVLGDGAERTIVDGSALPSGVHYGVYLYWSKVAISGLGFSNFGYVEGYRALSTYSTALELTACAFENNGTAVRPDGEDSDHVALIVRESAFTHNGGGLVLINGHFDSVLVENNLFIDDGFGSNVNTGDEGVPWILTNNVFVGGDGIHFSLTDTYYGYPPDVLIINNIFADVSYGWTIGDTYRDYPDVFEVANNLVGASTVNTVGNVDDFTESGTLVADPLFVAWSNDGDYTNDDFHLLPGSPGIDYGLDGYVTDDYDGVARPLDGDLDGTARTDVGAYEFNPDADGDGYASVDVGGDDCDDTDASVHPNSWYLDADGDGYGDPGSVSVLCTGSVGPEGYVTDCTDCDDAQAAIWPGAPETCGDAVDQDCDGVDAVCPDSGDGGDPADSGDPAGDGSDKAGCAYAPLRPGITAPSGQGSTVLGALALLALARRRPMV